MQISIISLIETNGWRLFLPLVLISIASIIIIKRILRIRQKKHQRQALKNYCFARHNFYFNERLKIIRHYRRRIQEGSLSVDAALKDVRTLLEAHSNDEWTWREEYQKFAKKMEIYR